jgi:hypothetical protein
MREVNYAFLKSFVDEFNRKYPRHNLVLSLEALSPIITKQMWQNANRAGLYFLFDENEVLQYIGKASFGSNIGVRIGERFSSKDCRCLIPKFSSVTLLATIALPEERIFEASSIEEYFIGELQPPLNVVGVT